VKGMIEFDAGIPPTQSTMTVEMEMIIDREGVVLILETYP